MTYFLFATGIENSNPTISGGPGGGRIRRDQMAECGHYARWRLTPRILTRSYLVLRERVPTSVLVRTAREMLA